MQSILISKNAAGQHQSEELMQSSILSKQEATVERNDSILTR